MNKLFGVVLLIGILSMSMGVAFSNACPPGFTPGFWKHNIGVYLGVANGAYSAFTGGPLNGVKCDASVLGTVPYDLDELYETLSTGGGGAIAQARADAANLLNAFFGYGPF